LPQVNLDSPYSTNGNSFPCQLSDNVFSSDNNLIPRCTISQVSSTDQTWVIGIENFKILSSNATITISIDKLRVNLLTASQVSLSPYIQVWQNFGTGRKSTTKIFRRYLQDLWNFFPTSTNAVSASNVVAGEVSSDLEIGKSSRVFSFTANWNQA
jgi:hypothetical protein